MVISIKRNAWFQASHSEKNLKVLSKLESRLMKMRAEMKSTESEFVQNLLTKPIEPSISFGQPGQGSTHQSRSVLSASEKHFKSEDHTNSDRAVRGTLNKPMLIY